MPFSFWSEDGQPSAGAFAGVAATLTIKVVSVVVVIEVIIAITKVVIRWLNELGLNAAVAAVRVLDKSVLNHAAIDSAGCLQGLVGLGFLQVDISALAFSHGIQLNPVGNDVGFSKHRI